MLYIYIEKELVSKDMTSRKQEGAIGWRGDMDLVKGHLRTIS